MLRVDGHIGITEKRASVLGLNQISLMLRTLYHNLQLGRIPKISSEILCPLKCSRFGLCSAKR